MEKTSQAWEELLPYLKTMRRNNYAAAILYYDLATACPEKSLGDQSELFNHFALENAAIAQDPGFIAAVKKILADKASEPMEIRLAESLYDQISLMEKMPLSDYLAARSACTKSNEMWRKYRYSNDFAAWLPYWKECVKWTRKIADLKRKEGQKCRYDSCLDGYEPGETSEFIDSLFIPLKKHLLGLLPSVLEKESTHRGFGINSYPIEKQEKLSFDLLKTIDYDLEGGCLRESAHPFSTDIHIHDARLTTKYVESDFRSNIYTIVHEGGHCLEFQNKPQEQYDKYVESVATAAICETHSRFYENIIGRSREFAPILQKLCAKDLDPAFLAMKEEDFFHLVNKVEPGLIRCDSDELTYSLHIIIRYEIEKDLVNGKIECEDVPALWNKKYKDYLGVDVPNDKDGCMQDVHWTDGEIGYFPSYALGNIYGAIIKETMEEKIDLSKLVKAGHFEEIREWFAKNDYAYDWMKPGEWIKKVTGKPLSSEPYLRYLDGKFSE
jgi:carboxypeptidase Taq